MRRLLDLSRMHWTVLFLLLCVAATVLAWMSFGLINEAMANAEFLLHYRLMAVVEGGAAQSALIALRGLVALIAYLAFKALETELIARWRMSGQTKTTTPE